MSMHETTISQKVSIQQKFFALALKVKQNKLECFYLASFQAGLVLVGRAKTHPSEAFIKAPL